MEWLLAFGLFALFSRKGGSSDGKPDNKTKPGEGRNLKDLVNAVNADAIGAQHATDIGVGAVEAGAGIAGAIIGGPVLGAAATAYSAAGASATKALGGSGVAQVEGAVNATLGVETAVAEQVAKAAGVETPAGQWAVRITSAEVGLALLAGPIGIASVVGALINGIVITAILEWIFSSTQNDAQKKYGNVLNTAYGQVYGQAKKALPDGPYDRFAANFADGFAYEQNRLLFERQYYKLNGDKTKLAEAYMKGKFCGYPIPTIGSQYPFVYHDTPRPLRNMDNPSIHGTDINEMAVDYIVPPLPPFVKMILGDLATMTLKTDTAFKNVFEAGRRAGNVSAYVGWMLGDQRHILESDAAFAQRGIKENAFEGDVSGSTLQYEGRTYDWNDYGKSTPPAPSNELPANIPFVT